MENKKSGIGFFEKFLSIWVLLCMAAGILIGRFLPAVPDFLGKLEYAHISIPIAVLIWVMIYPMMMKVDFKSVINVRKNPQGVLISSGTSWLIKPFLMFGLASFFFYVAFKAVISADTAQQYVAGAVLLGAAPCTAMVFVWSNLTKGDPAHTLVQVAFNDLIILIAFVPIVSLLLGISNMFVPWDTLFISIGLFVAVPLLAGILTRTLIIKRKGVEYFTQKFIPKFDNVTVIGLLLTLIIIFTFQGGAIINKPFHVVLIAVPLILQNVITAAFAYCMCKLFKQPHKIAAPAALIGASDFFELSVAVAIALYGTASPVVLVCTVGVLTEVPVMLILVKIVNKTKKWFDKEKKNMQTKTIEIYEKALCCATGVCGTEVDAELLRITSLAAELKTKGVTLDRANLSTKPEKFVQSTLVSGLIKECGIEILPLTVIDGKVVKKGEYPTNAEIEEWTGVKLNAKTEDEKRCCCKKGCC